MAEARHLPPLSLLILIAGIGPFVLNGVLPANSAVMQEFDTTYGKAQQVLTVFLVAVILAQLILGVVADRYGRRPTMIGGLLIFMLGSVLCAAAPSIGWLLAGRFVQGFGASVCQFLPRAIVRDVHQREKAASVIAFITMAMMVVPMFGPSLGGFVSDRFNWRWLYVLLAVVSALAVVLSWRYLNETGSAVARSERVGYLQALQRLLPEREFQGLVLALAGSVGIYYCFLAGSPWVAMESRGISATAFGNAFLFVAGAYIAGNALAGRFSEQMGTYRMVHLGLIPLALGCVLFWLLADWQSVYGVFLPMCCVALANGLTLPNLSSAAMSVHPDLAGSSSALSNALMLAFGALLSWQLGHLLPEGDQWLYRLISLSGAVYLLGLLRLRGFS